MIVSWKERENTKALSRCLKTASYGADATWRGWSFQTVAPVSGNARLPTVDRRTGGTVQTMTGLRPQPSSGCHVGNTGETRLWVGRRGAVDGSIRHNCQFEGDTFWNVQQVKADD